MGRNIWSSRELPDPLAIALWWKQRRWLFDDLRHNLHEDDRRIHEAESEYWEAKARHASLIHDMWLQRTLDRDAAAWRKLAAKDYGAEALVAMSRGLKETV